MKDAAATGASDWSRMNLDPYSFHLYSPAPSSLGLDTKSRIFLGFLEHQEIFREKWDFGGFLDDFEQIVLHSLPFYLRNENCVPLFTVPGELVTARLQSNIIVQQCFPYLMYPIIPREVSFKHGGVQSRAK